MKKKCVKQGRRGLVGIQLALGGQSIAMQKTNVSSIARGAFVTASTRETLILLKTAMKLRKPGERLQGWVWAPRGELLPAHSTPQEQLCLRYMALPSSSKETLQACVPGCLHGLYTLAPDCFELPDPAAARVGSHGGLHAFIHPSPWVSPGTPWEAHQQPLRPGGHRYPWPISEVLRTMLVEENPGERYPHHAGPP